MTLSPLVLKELRRSSGYIARKYGADSDDLYQEALIAAWNEQGPDTWKMRAGNWRAQSFATGGRRPFGHPGGTRSGATVPRSAIERRIVFDDDVTGVDRYVESSDLHTALAALPERQQRAALAVALDMDPRQSASFADVTVGGFRDLRSRTLRALRSSLVPA